MSVKDFLFSDPLAEIDHNLTSTQVRSRFADFLPDEPGGHLGVLYPFVSEQPWRYWTDSVVEEALCLLEKDKSRTYAAVATRESELDRALHVLFTRSPTILDEGSLPHSAAESYLRLSTDYLPEYLRWTEHVFGNLLSLYWSVTRGGGVDAKFRLRNAVDYMQQAGHAGLLDGYVDSVRNAQHRPERQATPLSLAGRLAAGAVNRGGLSLVGVVASELPLAGRQLHAAIRLEFRQREWVLGEASRVAARLIQAGATEYDRFLIEVDHGGPVSSLIIIHPRVLKTLMDEGADWSRLGEAFDDTQLLWYNESAWRTRLRGWRLILRSVWRQFKANAVDKWHEGHLWLGKGRFTVRDIVNLSSDGVARVRVMAVLRTPRDGDDPVLVNEIVHEVVKVGRRRLVRSRGGFLDKGIPWPRRPVHVLVDLYRLDGSSRWLRRGGWLAGNTVAVAERTWGGRAPILVDNPEQIHRGIRLRYNLDAEAALKAWAAVETFAEHVHAKRVDRVTGGPAG